MATPEHKETLPLARDLFTMTDQDAEFLNNRITVSAAKRILKGQ
jgi:hypothetical protein